MSAIAEIVTKRYKQETAKEMVVVLERLRTDVFDGPSIEAYGHFSVIVGAVKQLAEGKVEALHPIVAGSITSFLRDMSTASRAWARLSHPGAESMRERIKRIIAERSIFSEIAETLVDYSPEQAAAIKIEK